MEDGRQGSSHQLEYADRGTGGDDKTAHHAWSISSECPNAHEVGKASFPFLLFTTECYLDDHFRNWGFLLSIQIKPSVSERDLSRMALHRTIQHTYPAFYAIRLKWGSSFSRPFRAYGLVQGSKLVNQSLGGN